MGKHRLHHVGIIVPNAEQVEALLDLLGLERGETQYVPEYEADCVFTYGDGSAVEFIIPRGGKLAQFNRGIGGLHHIAIEVDDLEQFTENIKKKDIELLSEKPVEAGQLLINFLLPIYTRGFTVEFVETKKR
jgi:catechol 2,3-dioxygenase-like lactoylglutathione lyase family enzyme